MKRIWIFVLTIVLLGTVMLQASDALSKTPPAKSSKNSGAAVNSGQETGYWINNKSHIRHNKTCRYYGKGQNGRSCGPTDGKACKVCGG